MTGAEGVILGAGSVFVLGILIAGVVAFLRDRRESILREASDAVRREYVRKFQHDSLSGRVQMLEIRSHQIAEDAAS